MERFQVLLSYQESEWRYCHCSNGLVSSVLGDCYAPWMSAFVMQAPNQRGVRRAGQDGLQTRCDSELVSPPV